MRLSAIKIAGFKSFVEPTRLDMSHDLTGIVGPNGCGKSNIIDAVRWVTGESSAKQLRGQSLEDVIFTGTHKRKPVGRASVELSFDNKDKSLIGEYNRFDEVTVRRELTRDGTSKYFINNTRARRRDVVDLFLGTGLGGRNNYAVIEQGAVNRLIEAKPEQMRQVLEEAAGISRYKQRRHETEQRIRHTYENIERLNDLQSELDQQLETLAEQAQNAHAFRDLKHQQRRYKHQLLALRWHQLNSKLLAAAKAQKKAVQATQDAEHDYQNHTKNNPKPELDAADDACLKQQGRYYQAQAEAGRLQQALEHAKDLAAVKQREYQQLKSQQQQLDQARQHDSKAAQQLDLELQTLDERLQSLREDAQLAKQKLDETEREVLRCESRWELFNNQDNPQAKLEGLKSKKYYLQQHRQQLEKSQAKKQQQLQKLARKPAITNVDPADIEHKKAQLSLQESTLTTCNQKLETLDTTLEQFLAQQRQHTQQHAQLQAQLEQLKATQRVQLGQADRARQAWLKTNQLETLAVMGRQVSAPAEFSQAVEYVLNDWLQALAIDSLEALENTSNMPAIAFVETADVEPEYRQIRELDNLGQVITAPAALKAIASHYFVAKTDAQAQLHRWQLSLNQWIVTPSGHIWGRYSLKVLAASKDEHESALGVLEREKQITATTRKLTQLQETLEDLAAKRADIEHKQDGFRKQAKAAQQNTIQLRQQLNQLESQQQAATLAAEHEQQKRRDLTEQLAQIKQQQNALQADLQTLKQTLEAQQQASQQWRDEQKHRREQLKQARQARDQARHIQQKAGFRVHEHNQRRQSLEHQRQLLTHQLQSHQQRQAQIQQQLTQSLDGADGQQRIEGIKQQLLAAKQQLEDEQAQLKVLRERQQSLQIQVREHAEAQMRAQHKLNQTQQAQQQAQITLEAASARCEALLEQAPENTQVEQLEQTLKTLDAKASVSLWQQKITKLDEQVKRLGAINLAAIEDYKKQRERSVYLQSQHDDLAAALETLKQAIAKIDRETRSRFKATYNAVHQRFSEIFPTLFNGGTAELALTENDWLSTGVTVMARPPGKRNTTIQMLSGGEKTLTAIALLFALFELNPAPFCMLDEIDAPLDDANVARFCELVATMSQHVQFIIITHNKLTMELVHQLHGVTMMEPGVSRLVSVNIDQALDLAS